MEINFQWHGVFVKTQQKGSRRGVGGDISNFRLSESAVFILLMQRKGVRGAENGLKNDVRSKKEAGIVCHIGRKTYFCTINQNK